MMTLLTTFPKMRVASACAGLVCTLACETGPTSPSPTPWVIGVAEVTFRDLQTTRISASMLLAKSIADLERDRTVEGSSGNLDVIDIETIATAVFTHGPPGARTRFLRATFGLRNAHPEHATLDASRENLSFVAVSTGNTVPQTAVRTFERQDRSPASETLARQLIPTGIVAVDADGELVVLSSVVLKDLTPDDVGRTVLPADAIAAFPYAFVVRRAPNTVSGDTSPTRTTFDGMVTFAYRIPDEPDAQNRPATVSVLFLIVDGSVATEAR